MDAYLGQIKLFAGNYAPQNWAICDGTVLSIAENGALYSLLGTTWGGNGTTNFALPDLRGRLPVGQGQGTQLTNRVIGQTGGTSSVLLNQSNYPSHSHPLRGSSKPANTAAITANVGLATTARSDSGFLTRYADTTQTGTNTPTVVEMDALSITPTGATGPQSHTNIMPFMALNYIICVNGMYPSRP